MTGYRGLSSGDFHSQHSPSGSCLNGVERKGSIRKNSDFYHLPEEYIARSASRRGRSSKTEYEDTSSARGRSLSSARNQSARSSSRQPVDRSTVTQSSTSSRSSRGRSLSMARSARSPSRAPSKSRSSTAVVPYTKNEEHRDVAPSVPSRSRSKSRARSKSGAPSKSRRKAEAVDDSALVPVSNPSGHIEEDSRRRSLSQARKTSSGSQRTGTGSRKFIVEIDGESNDIIGVNELVEDEEEHDSSGSGGSNRSGRGRGFDSYKPVRARSRSILRSSSHKSSITSQERVKFALDNDTDERASTLVEEPENTHTEGRGRGMHDQSTSRQSRSLSRQRIEFNDVDFDPPTHNVHAHGNLMELLQKPHRPYEQSISPRKNSVTTSNHTEDTTLTIEEEVDDDDSFGYSFGTIAMQDVIHQHTMEDVAEEDEEGTVLSGCPSYQDQRYDQSRNHSRQDPSRHSMPNNYPGSSLFKNKLKPVSFNIRKTNKRQTAPQCKGSRESQDTDGTLMSTDDEFEKSPTLFVDRAADSLMLHQKHNQHDVHFHQKSDSRKSKSKLSRFLHR